MTMSNSTSQFKWRFFKTKKEKDFILKKLQAGNVVPLLVYIFFLLGLTRYVKVKRRHYDIYLSRSPYALWLYFHKTAVRKEEEFVSSYLEEGDTVVDCGAHLGTVSFTASFKVGESGKVLSIEAHPGTFRKLKRNGKLQPQKNILFLHNAVGEKEGWTHITSSYVSDMNHISERGKEVKMITLKSHLEKLRRVALLKLDVEGMEISVLRGAGESLSVVDAILFESSESLYERNGYSLHEMFHFLKMRGYDVYRFSGESVYDMEKIDYLYKTKTRYEDLVAVKGPGKIRLQKMLERRQPF